MQHIDIKEFYAEWRNQKLGNLTKNRVKAIDTLIDNINQDPFDFTLQQMAYVLATIYHETGATMAPAKEILQVSTNTPSRKAMKKRQARYLPYYGRGYVQITWSYNYEKMGKRLAEVHWGYDDKMDKPNWLADNPDLALDNAVAWDIISVGMREGLFTGKKLSDYFPNTGETVFHYLGARRIVNGTDKSAMIAGYARKFEKILNKSYSEDYSILYTDATVWSETDSLTDPLQYNTEPVVTALEALCNELDAKLARLGQRNQELDDRILKLENNIRDEASDRYIRWVSI